MDNEFKVKTWDKIYIIMTLLLYLSFSLFGFFSLFLGCIKNAMFGFFLAIVSYMSFNSYSLLVRLDIIENKMKQQKRQKVSK